MNKRTVEFIVDIAKQLDHDVEVYENYSGRGMYGKTTYGIRSPEYPSSYLLDVIAYLYEEAYRMYEDFNELEVDFHGEDSLGKGNILY